MHLVKAQFRHQIHRPLILLLGFPGKADDYVGAEGHAGDGIPDAAGQFPVIVPGIGPAHPPQHFIIPGLHRQVDVFANLGQIGDGADDAVIHIRGMGSEKADPFQSVNIIQPGQQEGQIGLLRQVVAIGIHGLPQHGDFPDAALGQQFGLLDNFVHRAADLTAAAVGNDAETAHKIAAVDDGNVAGYIGMGRGQGADAARPIQSFALPDQFQQRRKILGAHKQIHLGKALFQFGGLRADHAAHQGQHPVGPALFQGADTPQVAHHLILGPLADDAGIEDDDIGGLGVGRRAQAQLFQGRPQAFRVGLVHLAADSPNVKGIHSCRSG